MLKLAAPHAAQRHWSHYIWHTSFQPQTFYPARSLLCLQEAERAPNVTVEPLGPAALKLAVARLADLDLPLQQQQYSYEALADLRDVPIPTHAPK
jgi:hypothetical protein